MTDKIKLRVLVVEDDARMLDLLCRGLREEGHAVMPASDGQAGLELATSFSFDVIVLDIGLPQLDGFNVTQALRMRNKTVAILMLTARDAEDDIIRGLDLGADDYLIKPFSFPELIARLQAVARTTQARDVQAQLVLDPARLMVTRENTPIQLTRTEFLLLSSLTQVPGQPVARQSLIESVWGKEHPISANTLDVLVNALRGKLDAPFHSRMIQTVRGIGYRLLAKSICGRSALEELQG
jgi:DNA-binding response OmpR family regulator